jgi:hypothetical protein
MDGRFLDMPAVGKPGPRKGDRDQITDRDVLGTAHDGDDRSSQIDLTQAESILLRVRTDVRDAADHHLFRFKGGLNLFNPFDLKASHGEALGQLARAQVDLYKILQPIEAYFHRVRPPYGAENGMWQATVSS